MDAEGELLRPMSSRIWKYKNVDTSKDSTVSEDKTSIDPEEVTSTWQSKSRSRPRKSHERNAASNYELEFKSEMNAISQKLAMKKRCRSPEIIRKPRRR